MKRTIFFGTLLLMFSSSLTLFAQQFVKQVIIVNGGLYEFSPPFADHVTVSSYNPQTNQTVVFDTIYTESAQDVIINGNYVYVTAQDSIIMYNIDTYQRHNAIELSGLNLINIFENYLLVGRGNGITSDFFQIYDATNLQLIKTFTEVTDETFGITINNSIAYISVPGSWASTVGKIAKIDLTNLLFIEEIELDTLGQGIREIIIENDNLYSFNTMSYGYSYGVVSNIDLITDSIINTKVDAPFGNGFSLCAITKIEDIVYLIVNGNIAKYDISLKQLVDTNFISFSETVAEVVYDSINGLFYITLTDYYSYGTGLIYNLNGIQVGSFIADISAQALAIDYRNTTNIESKLLESGIIIFPNPATDILNIYSDKSIKSITILDLLGKTLYHSNNNNNSKIDISDLSKGYYVIDVKYIDNSFETKKIIKK